MLYNNVVYTKIRRPRRDQVERARAAGVAMLHEAMGIVSGRLGLMSPRMRPLNPGLRIAGPAITAYNHPGSGLMVHVANHLAQPGDVLVLCSGGSDRVAQWGDMATTQAQERGVAGVVIDGAVRDSDELIERRFPVWSTSVSAAHPERNVAGAVNVPVVCDGVLVRPGDLVVADTDGVLVVPFEDIDAVLAAAEERARKEEAIVDGVRSGRTMYEILGLEAVLDQLGTRRIDAVWDEA
ncbi:MAG TPA: 4-carboxy-4-hydroxy-2-oxoadipate aldolase/oxaloacetate decarboxylase [Bacillota bacterium]